MLKKLSLLPSLVGAVALALGVYGCSGDAPVASSESTPLLRGASGNGRYIVTLNDDVTDVPGVVAAMAADNGMVVDHVYEHAMKGFSAEIPAGRLYGILHNPHVALVEEDAIATACSTSTFQTLPWGINDVQADISSTIAGNHSGEVTDVRIYIVDTGIKLNHGDLNLVGGMDFVGDRAGVPSNWYDLHGHGTHVAGTAAARDNDAYVVGVAPGAPLWAVRVLNDNGSGAYSGIIAGLDWVIAHVADPIANPNGERAVINMSIGGPANTSLDNAVRRCVSAGIVVCVAAGNNSRDAVNYSPARTVEAITVGAYDSKRALATFSNYGSVVDIEAPGVNILSTSILPEGYQTMSGTSMACPHVTGAAALYLSVNRTATAAQVQSAIKSAATPNAIKLTRKSTTKSALNVQTF